MKIKQLVLCIVLLCSFCSCNINIYAADDELPVPYPAERAVNFDVKCPVTELTVGDTVYIDIEADGETDGLYACELSVGYDEQYLTYSGTESRFADESLRAEDNRNGSLGVALCSPDGAGGSGGIARIRFTARRSGSFRVTLENAILVYDDLSYSAHSLSESVNVSVRGTGGNYGGGGGGGTGGGSFSVGGGANASTGVSPTMEPSAQNTPTEEPKFFPDLASAEWARVAVTELYSRSVINGYDDGSFMPNNSITRAEFLKMLTAAAGIEITPQTGELPFNDVSEDDWYAPYIAAAYAGGITLGYEDGSFLPEAEITREEAAVMVCRCIDVCGISIEAERLNINFVDESDISDYAVGYIDRLYCLGVINGDENGSFNPGSNMSRAEAAQMIWNLIEKQSDGSNEQAEELEGLTEMPETASLGERKSSAVNESPSPDSTSEPETTPSLPPESTSEPEPETTPTPLPESTSAPEPESTPTLTPDDEFEADITFECESMTELYSSNNVYAYEIPDDGSREAFYDDFTTFQRSAPGDAEIVFSAPYAEESEVVSYYYAGEPLVDFAFETSIDGETWSAAEFDRELNTADGKWTAAVYRLKHEAGVRYFKIIYPETVNSWTPLVSEVMFKTGGPMARELILAGLSELIIPRFDYTDYAFSGYVADQIGEEMESEITYSIKDSTVEGLEISDTGVVRIENDFPGGGTFTVSALSEDYGLESEMNVTLKAAQLGDTDGSGSVDSVDLSRAIEWFRADKTNAQWSEYRYADINGDEYINVLDIAYISKKAGGQSE